MSNVKKIFLAVRGGGDYTEADACLVTLDKELIDKIRSRAKLAKAAKAADPEFHTLTFWDYSPTFLVLSSFDEDLAEELVCGASVDAPADLDEDSLEAVRVECVEMVVDGDGDVCWSAILKHTDCYLGTDKLRLSEILD
jgi:hypothetical protein